MWDIFPIRKVVVMMKLESKIQKDGGVETQRGKISDKRTWRDGIICNPTTVSDYLMAWETFLDGGMIR